MSLKLTVSEDLKTAMKEKNTAKLSILRVLKGEIERNGQTAVGKVELSDSEIIKIVKKLIDSIKETTNNQVEITTLENYLPRQLSEKELSSIVNGCIESYNYTTLGELMGYFKKNFDGQYDGKALSSIVKENLA